MSVTELRDDQANEWQSWALNNPDDALAHNRRRRDELAKETSGKKVRLCEFVSTEGSPCVRSEKATGLCTGHYTQAWRGEKLRPLRGDITRTCGFSEGSRRCEKVHYGKGWCIGHYRQVERWGADKVRPLRAQRSTAETRLVPSGSRNGEPWAEWEFDLAMSDMPLREVALRLGRTYSSVVRARQRRRRMLGLGIEYTKSEADLYDGSDRRGVLYAKEKK